MIYTGVSNAGLAQLRISKIIVNLKNIRISLTYLVLYYLWFEIHPFHIIYSTLVTSVKPYQM